MSKSFSTFKQQVLEQSGLAQTLFIYGEDVKITSENEVFVNNHYVKTLSTLEEASSMYDSTRVSVILSIL